MKNITNYNNTRRLHCLLLCALLCLLLTVTCQAQALPNNDYHCITHFENGSINWTTGVITAVGKASPKDNTELSHESVPGAARAGANRQIIQILKNIRIQPGLTVEEYASKNDIILAGIEKTARDAVVSRQYYTSDLAVELKVSTSMLGGFLQLVLPEDIRQITRINPELPLKTKTTEGRNLHTGLLIDARGLVVEPVLSPVIISEQGHDIYSGEFISREFAVKNGVCKYICSMEEAINDRRIGNYPIVLKALRTEGKQNAAIVISMSDYLLLEKATERHTFLKECKVVIVKDQ